MRTKKNVTTANAKNGSFFNLATGPVSLEAIESSLPEVQKEISALPEGKGKTTIAHAFGNFYGYVKCNEWLRGITPVTA